MMCLVDEDRERDIERERKMDREMENSE